MTNRQWPASTWKYPPGIVALVGLNGADKSTLMRLLLGMLRPDGGEAEVLGCPVANADRAVWSRVGHLIETPPRMAN